MKTKQWLIDFKSSLKAKKTFKLIILLIFELYVFFIPSFSGRVGFNYIGYFIFAILSAMIILYVSLFSTFRLALKHFLMPIFAVYALLGTIIYSHAYREWLTIFLMSVTYFIFVLFFDEIKNKRVLLYICLFPILCFAFYFIAIYWRELIDISNIGTARLGDYFNNVNAVSNFFAFGFGLSLFLSLFFNKKVEILNIISSPLFFVLGVSTGSRTFIIITALIVMLLVFFKFKKQKVVLLISIALVVVSGVVLISMPFMSNIRERFFDMFKTLFSAEFGESSTIQRIIMQRYAFFLGTKNLFIGLGAGGFATFSGYGTYSHSNIFEVFANFGIIGFISFYFLWFYSFYYSKKQNSIYKYFAMAFLFAELIHGFFSVLFSSKIAALELAMCISLCVPYSKEIIINNFHQNNNCLIDDKSYYQIEV